jgi:hypothetical protein
MTVSVPFRLPEIPAAPNGTAKNTPPAGERPGGGTEKPATPEGPGPPVTEDSKPALEKPAPPPSAPKVDEGAALRRADIANMLTLVNRFGSAYQGRDVDGMKAAWPGMSRGAEDSFRSVFRTYSRMGWTLQSQDWSVDGDKAIAICGVQVSQTDIRGNATRTERRSYRFSFERRATGWTLINVENLGGVR